MDLMIFTADECNEDENVIIETNNIYNMDET